MNSEQSRIKQLENVLNDLVSYLTRLPPNPETYRQAMAARAALEKPGDEVQLVGECRRPDGVAVIGAQLVGDRLTMFTQNVNHMPPGFQLDHKNQLYDALVDGVDVTLRQCMTFNWASQFGAAPDRSTPPPPSYLAPMSQLRFLMEAARGGEVHQGHCIPPLEGYTLDEYIEQHVPSNQEICPVCVALEELAASIRDQDRYTSSTRRT